MLGRNFVTIYHYFMPAIAMFLMPGKILSIKLIQRTKSVGSAV